MSELSELSKPVMYSLRFRNMHTGEPYKNINADTTFSTLEKAKAYGLGTRYVTQDDGKMVRVRDTSRDPIVEPLYSQEYVSALTQRVAELEAKLATPVRLPVVLMGCQSDDYRIGFMEGVEKSGEEVRAAGFTVEGDE